MSTTKAHRFCDIQSTTSAALLRIQLKIAPMVQGNAYDALKPNHFSKLAKVLFSF